MSGVIRLLVEAAVLAALLVWVRVLGQWLPPHDPWVEAVAGSVVFCMGFGQLARAHANPRQMVSHGLRLLLLANLMFFIAARALAGDGSMWVTADIAVAMALHSLAASGVLSFLFLVKRRTPASAAGVARR